MNKLCFDYKNERLLHSWGQAKCWSISYFFYRCRIFLPFLFYLNSSSLSNMNYDPVSIKKKIPQAFLTRFYSQYWTSFFATSSFVSFDVIQQMVSIQRIKFLANFESSTPTLNRLRYALTNEISPIIIKLPYLFHLFYAGSISIHFIQSRVIFSFWHSRTRILYQS